MGLQTQENLKGGWVMKRLMALSVVAVLLSCLAVPGFVFAKGTAAEAEAMVKKAVEFYKANGKQKALAEISNPKGQFVKEDLYIFTLDMNGVVTGHGANEKLINKDMSGLKDVDGKLFIAECLKIAKEKGKGWVDYKWSNPTTNKVEPKSTYFEKVDDIVFACGIYK
jgi:signal transduction histidine kinase